MALVYALFALLAGAMLPFQAGINARLAEFVGGPVRASLVSFLVGSFVLFVVAVLFYRGRSVHVGDAPWWVWVGGALGAFYVTASVVTAPKLGAAALIVILVAGQSVAALVIDHFGWVGFPVHHVSPGRLAGVALLGAGVALVRFA
jgi:bacterial/archaeal transporter family-2 protein